MDADGTLKPIHAVFQVYIILSILYYAIDTCLGTDRNAKLRRFFWCAEERNAHLPRQALDKHRETEAYA